MKQIQKKLCIAHFNMIMIIQNYKILLSNNKILIFRIIKKYNKIINTIQNIICV